MPLNKAQLMEVPGGPGITGSIKSGTGIIISGDGTISVNPATNVTKLLAGTNITLNPANGFGAVTITAGGGGGGTITGVTAGTGLSGGGTSGSVTLSNSGVLSVSTSSAGFTFNPTTGSAVLIANPQTTTVFDSITVIQGTDWSANTSLNAQEGSTGPVIVIPIPNGANAAILISRARGTIFSKTTFFVQTDVAVPTMWVQNLGYQMSFSGSFSLVDAGGGAEIPFLALPATANRGTCSFMVRFDLLNCSGSGNRSGNINTKGYFSQGQGSGDGLASVQNLQFEITPYAKGN